MASSDLFKRWVTLGLLDTGATESLGYRRGVRRTWSEHQRGLFLSLLDKHRDARSIRALANVPVLVWLLWGDEYVPLRQVRRCMETWTGLRRRRQSAYGHLPAAQKLIRNLARRGANPQAKAALVDALVDSSLAGVFDLERVRPLLAEVVGRPDPSAQTDGPRVLDILQAQWVARARFFEFTDGYFRWARVFYLYAKADYAQQRPALAADPRFGKLHPQFDLQNTANQACHDVLLNLGIALTAPPNPGAPEYLQLGPWLENRAHLMTTIDVERSPLLLPRGVLNGRLGIGVQVTVDPKQE